MDSYYLLFLVCVRSETSTATPSIHTEIGSDFCVMCVWSLSLVLNLTLFVSCGRMSVGVTALRLMEVIFLNLASSRPYQSEVFYGLSELGCNDGKK